MEKAQFYEIFATHTHKTLGLVRLVSGIFKGIELFSVDWWLRDIIVSSKPTTINEFLWECLKRKTWWNLLTATTRLILIETQADSFQVK